MRKARTRLADEPAARPEPAVRDPRRIRANGWPVLPLRLFLAALFCFAGYAKLTYPDFFEPDSRNGFKSTVDAASEGDSPLAGMLGPLVDHPSLFGHITAYAEIAIGLGLLVGLLTRFAALGGMILTTLILLSIDWNGVKEYTGSSGWFTAVDLAVAAALSIFLLGGPGPLALDNLFIRARERQRARDDDEPGFRDSDLDESRRRLQGEPAPAHDAAGATAQLPVAGGAYRGGADRDDHDHPDRERERLERERSDRERSDRERDHPDRGASSYRPEDRGGAGYRPADRGEAGYRAGGQDEEYRDDPEPDSLWTEGRRGADQPRRDAETPGQTDR